jgi:hypothetical protein
MIYYKILPICLKFRLLSGSSFTHLAKKYGVGRNTLKRLYDEWEI